MTIIAEIHPKRYGMILFPIFVILWVKITFYFLNDYSNFWMDEEVVPRPSWSIRLTILWNITTIISTVVLALITLS
jgi:uncharacterized membrane protein (DUF485 family)